MCYNIIDRNKRLKSRVTIVTNAVLFFWVFEITTYLKVYLRGICECIVYAVIFEHIPFDIFIVTIFEPLVNKLIVSLLITKLSSWTFKGLNVSFLWLDLFNSVFESWINKSIILLLIIMSFAQ